MDQKALQKSMGRLKTANKFRMKTAFNYSALGDNLDNNEEKENFFPQIRHNQLVAKIKIHCSRHK